MHNIANIINNRLFTSKKEVILCNINLIESRGLVAARNDRWSDYYYLQQMRLPIRFVSEDISSFVKVKDRSQVLDKIFIGKVRELIDVLEKENISNSQIYIIWSGNEYVIFSLFLNDFKRS
jgi:hypothetical protein